MLRYARNDKGDNSVTARSGSDEAIRSLLLRREHEQALVVVLAGGTGGKHEE